MSFPKKVPGSGGPMVLPTKPMKVLPTKPKKRAGKPPKAMHQQIAEKMMSGY